MTIELIVNERIAARHVKLIVDEKLVGIVSIRDALARARDRGLDLVQVTPTVEGEQPICRILDADRYRFERSKAEREHARRQRELTVDTKEIRLKPAIGQADLALKARHAKAFLEAGDKVKVTMKFKGREKSHKNAGRQVIEHLISQVGEHCIDKPFSDGDGEISIVLGSTISKAEILKKTEKTREDA